MSGNRIDEQLCDSREESAITPKVQGKTLVYRQDGQEQVLTVDTEAWFAWLETASTFSFLSEEGLFTARREQAGHKRGGWYWKAYRKQHGKLSSAYLGKSESVTIERLRAVAMKLAGEIVLPGRASDVHVANESSPGVPSGVSMLSTQTDQTPRREHILPLNFPLQLTPLVGREWDRSEERRVGKECRSRWS